MRVGIALGSNLGDRIAHLRAAINAIRRFAEAPLLISRVYETKPVNCPPGSPPFLNAAIEIGYSQDIWFLFEQLQTIEKNSGRSASRKKNTPRTIDLDILYADDLIINESNLTIPHPRLMERAFVIIPINDIVPNRKIPNCNHTWSSLMKNLKIEDCNLTEFVLNQ